MKLSSRLRTPSRLSDSLNHRLNLYALAASAAGVGALALAPHSEAKIVYTKTHVVLDARSNSYYGLDLAHDGIVDFYLSHSYFLSTTVGGVQSFISGVFVPYDAKVDKLNGVAGRGDSAYALPAGVKVGSLDDFRTEGLMARANGPVPPQPPNNYNGLWANGGKGVRNRYLGFRFAIQGKVHYGWARVTISKWPWVATLTGYAYESIPNKPITAGRTHGPNVVVRQATLGALALGRK